MGSLRPDRVVLVVGTGTEVGKTWVSAQLLAALRASGVAVAARKLAQSFERGEDPRGLDSSLLGAASGEAREVVCPAHRCYDVAMAPPMAAEVLGRPGFTMADLLAELRWPEVRVDVGLVESAGGVRSPQANDGDAVDLAQQLNPDVVLLVADAGLGTINSVRLSMDALAQRNRTPETAVVLNRFDAAVDLHRRNAQWLGERDGYRVITLPAEVLILTDLVRGPPRPS